jgi:uncharacterized protein YdeI (YjbR/CyaY-like superfamily)
MKTEPQIDIYIANAVEYARPLLIHLRQLVHSACPDTEEKIKWGFPHFDYKGPMCSMAAFKQHCAFTFWKGDLLSDPNNVLDKARTESMGQLGKLTTLADLPPDDILIGLIKEAMKLNEAGVKLPQKPKSAEKKELQIPGWFSDALKTNHLALENFAKFSYSHKKEYVDWVTEAKREETRTERMKKTLGLLAEGKSRNWKYERLGKD